jgi:hypothetical protein
LFVACVAIGFFLGDAYILFGHQEEKVSPSCNGQNHIFCIVPLSYKEIAYRLFGALLSVKKPATFMAGFQFVPQNLIEP